MRWTERQRALLQEIGVRLFPRPGEADAVASVEVSAVDDDPRAAGVRAEPMPDRHAGTQRLERAGGRAPARTADPIRRRDPDQRLEPTERHGPAVSPGPTGRHEPAGRADWDALAAMTCRCGRAALLGSGHRHAHWMLVGDAADGAEVFDGRAGELLDNMLRALQLTRASAAPSQQVYLAGISPCRAAGGGAESLCSTALLRQVQLVQPRVIVAMGRLAAQTLAEISQPLGQLRGRLLRHAGIPVVCTYHPAYLLRNPEDKARAWDDLCLALQALRAPV